MILCGKSLRDIAKFMGIPWAFKRVLPGAARTALETIDLELSSLIGAYLPRTCRPICRGEEEAPETQYMLVETDAAPPIVHVDVGPVDVRLTHLQDELAAARNIFGWSLLSDGCGERARNRRAYGRPCHA
jgi:hypothetical protein